MVVLADAHLDDLTIDFFRAMRPQDEKPYIIKNEFRSGDRQVYWYEGEDSSAIVAQIHLQLMLGLKVMVLTLLALKRRGFLLHPSSLEI
ncbi:MAG TPA: hypothetical protein V6D25_23125 [Leptolyngbyaceae cyanobacterium]